MVSVPKMMWLRLPTRPVANTMMVCMAMKITIHTRTRKCSVRATCRLVGPAPKPNRAAIAGACMGLGTQIAIACDLRLATPDARFAVPVAKLGLMVDHWTVQRLALLAGQSTARWMMLTARPVTAADAHRVGLVHELVHPDGAPGAGVLQAAEELAAEIATLAPLALAGSKLGLDLLARPGDQADPDGAYLAAFEAASTESAGPFRNPRAKTEPSETRTKR